MHRRRKYWIVFVMLAMIVLCCGCGKSDLETSQSYTYDVATGDKIKITFQTKGGYVISPDTPFVISRDGNTLSQGTFISKADYMEYAASIESASSVALLDSGSKGNIEYIYWTNGSSEYDYAILIKDSETGVLLGNNVSQESAEDCFGRISFENVK